MKEKYTPQINFDMNLEYGAENESYLRSQSDQQLSVAKDADGVNDKHMHRTISAGASTFPVIPEAPAEALHAAAADLPCPSPSFQLPVSAPPTVHTESTKPRATIFGSFEREASVPDPMSDSVSTILVWQNLTVSTREKPNKTFLQRLRLSKTVAPQRKVLLHNLSGSITGGLWAVMGKFRFALRKTLSTQVFVHL
jgi:hypothetical protein